MRSIHSTALALVSLLSLAACSVRSTEHARAAPTEPSVSQRPGRFADHIQSAPPWNLDRIDQSRAKLDGSYTCWESCGSGVHIYVIDSGIRCTHVDFGGRCGAGADFVGDGNGTNDCFGHGTQMAGIAAGTIYGVAKLATLHPVRVLNCSGVTVDPDATIHAIEWVIANGVHPGVINISLSGTRDDPTDAAIQAANAAGFLVVIAAGNGVGQDACNTAGAVGFTVGSSIHSSQGKGSDAIHTGSNVGPCVEIFAPGTSIQSDWYTSDVATLIAFDGTSQATAHVSGAAALYLAEHPTASEVAAYLINTATVGALTNAPAGTANRLLRTHAGVP